MYSKKLRKCFKGLSYCRIFKELFFFVLRLEAYNFCLDFNDMQNFELVIARYRFSSDIVETLPSYYFMLLEYMCEVSILLTIQSPRKIIIKKKVKKEVKH